MEHSIYLVTAVIGCTLLAIQIILQLIGVIGDGDIDSHGDVDIDTDVDTDIHDLEAGAFEHHADKVFADIVQVALYRTENCLADSLNTFASPAFCADSPNIRNSSASSPRIL